MASESKRLEFTGTLMDGPEVDLVGLSGLILSDEKVDELWAAISPRDLLLEASSVEELEVDEIDGVPGMTDRYFQYICEDKEDLSNELRALILSYVEIGDDC